MLVVGFDGMDAALARSWAAQGRMPALRRLLGTSAWCQFDIPPDYASGMVWPSINTGLRPAEHGSGFGTRLVDSSYRLRPRAQHDLRGEPFWKAFADAGRRIVIADVPFSRVWPECGGRQFWGWGQHDWVGQPASHPPGLLEELRQRFGSYPVRHPMDYALRPDSLQRLREELFAAIDRRAELLETLLQPPAWDLFYCAFPEPHLAGHMFWHLHDPAHPLHAAMRQPSFGDPLRLAYERLDASLGRVLAQAGEATDVAVFFSHGMGPNYHADHLFAELLRRFNAGRGDALEDQPARGGLERVWRHTVTRLPEAVRRGVKMRLPTNLRRWASAKRAENPARWRASRSFALPRLDGFSAARVNLRGREPAGRVGPQEFHAYLDALEAEIRTWTDAETGQPAVARVYRASPAQDPLAPGAGPDLMVWWSKSKPLRAIQSPRLGRVAGEAADERSGEHVMHSLLIVNAPGLAPGPRRIDGMGLPDIAPTLCDLAGVPLPRTARGRSRCQALRDTPPEPG